MEKRRSLQERTLFPNVLPGFFSLVTLALSICILLGCKSQSDLNYQLYSVNGSAITQIIAKNCTSCNLTNVSDRYMFGLSGTCRSTNGTVHCQGAFPNTFNITAAIFADILSPNTSNTVLANANQLEQITSTTPINHTLVHRLGVAVSAILVASVVLNFFFILLRFFVNPKSSAAQNLYISVLLTFCGQSATVVMVYLIIRDEITRPALGTDGTHLKAQYEVGFWLLVAAAASQLLNALSSPTKPKHQKKSLWDTDNVDEVFHAHLISKLVSIIKRLRTAVATYPHLENIDEGCKKLLAATTDDEQLAYILSKHFYQSSAALFLGMHPMATGAPPGPLLWENCPSRGSSMAPVSRRRGVYLVVLGDCSHAGRSQTNTSKYMYVGSGRSARNPIGGVMLRVVEHTDPGYRNQNRSELYRVWDTCRPECIAIYLLAEWDPLPLGANPGLESSFNDILLAEAIWQVALQTSIQGQMSDFTQFLRSQVPGDSDLTSTMWSGCNFKSALEI